MHLTIFSPSSLLPASSSQPLQPSESSNEGSDDDPPVCIPRTLGTEDNVCHCSLSCESQGFATSFKSTVDEQIAQRALEKERFSGSQQPPDTPHNMRAAIVCPCLEGEQLQEVLNSMSNLKRDDPTMFLILWHAEATENANLRAEAFKAGANMVSHSLREVETALGIMAQQKGGGSLICNWCGLQGLTPTDMWLHQPLYHIYQPSLEGRCQACGEEVPNMAVHIHEMHHPYGPHPEIRTGSGSAVVVHRKRDNKFLMVQEFAGQGFWVPGGGSDPGESLSACAVRECKEEAGVTVKLKGLLGVMHRDTPRLWRLAIYYAVPEEEDGAEQSSSTQSKSLFPPQKPKTLPNFESAGACWVSAADLNKIPVRNFKVVDWFERVARGDFQLLPMDIWPPAAQHIFADLAT